MSIPRSLLYNPKATRMRSNNNDSGTQPYQGSLIITNQTLTFHGTTIQ